MYRKYFKEIDRIFQHKSKKEELNEIIKRGFCYSEFEQKKLLFVGINPSYLKDLKPENFHYNVYKAVIDYKKHYAKFLDLLKNTKYEKDWTYIDLFFFRETNQNIISKIINSDIDFIVNQLKLTNKIINEINPEIVVVCNSGASNFFGINKIKEENIWLGYKFTFDKDFGIEVVTNIDEKSILDNTNDLQNIIGKPFLFSSTLNYLDSHNKKRLNWIINLVGENIETIKNKYHVLIK